MIIKRLNYKILKENSMIEKQLNFFLVHEYSVILRNSGKFFGVIDKFHYQQDELGNIICVNITIEGKIGNYISKTLNYNVKGREQEYLYKKYYEISDNFKNQVQQFVNDDYILDIIPINLYDEIVQEYYNFRLFLGLSLNGNIDDFEEETIEHINYWSLSSFLTKLNDTYNDLIIYDYFYKNYYKKIKEKMEEFFLLQGYIPKLILFPIHFEHCYQGKIDFSIIFDWCFGNLKIFSIKSINLFTRIKQMELNNVFEKTMYKNFTINFMIN